MKDERFYNISVTHGVATLHVGWHDEHDEIMNVAQSFSIHTLARMTRAEANAVVNERMRRYADEYNIKPVPPHVVAALLTLALGEPPLA